MTKIYVKLYDDFEITGRDFVAMKSDTPRRLIFSPNGTNSISVVSLKDGTLLFTNGSQCEFDFSVSRNGRLLARVNYEKMAESLTLNNNWLLNQECVQNRFDGTNADMVRSEILNIDFEGTALGRVDFKINTSPIAAGFFTQHNLVFVRMNGNHAFPRLKELVQSEAARMPLTEQQVLDFISENPEFQLPVNEGQVSTFLNNNPEFAAALPISEHQVMAFLNENPETENKVRKAAFKRAAEKTGWFST